MSVKFTATATQLVNTTAAFATSGLTFMVWYQIRAMADFHTLLKWSDDAEVLEIRNSDRLPDLWINNSSQTFSAVPLVIGKWCHLTVTRDAGASPQTTKLYQNGVLTVAVSSSTTPSNLTIASSTEEFLDGTIVGGKFWTATLTPAEIQTEINWNYPIRTANLYAVYPMHTTSSSLHLVDQSGNGHNLTLAGTTQTSGSEPPVYADRYTPVFYPVPQTALPNVLSGQLYPR